DFLIIGGGMVFTFLKAKGYQIGKSLLEEDLIDTAKEMLLKNESKIILPIDIIAASEFSNDASKKTVTLEQIPTDMMGLDIGPKSVELFSKIIRDAKTIVWNGPMGAFEMPSFANGTNEIAKTIAETDCLSIVGGGDSVTAVNKSGMAEKISYISTGGGAFLELLEGITLPAIAALDK
ncbi:MAG: phosphoglycerate kinase, partial [Spirochaetota bacterium]|nr:phosphoglycerate kinase [Spirochaetota bacterium]